MLYTILNSTGVLDQVCDLVDDLDKQVMPFLPSAYNLLLENKGVAIAAPQIGIQYAWYLDYKGVVYINPIIIEKDNLTDKLEQCLSIPGFTAVMRRYQNITLQFTDLKNDMKIQKLSGLDAQIAQHEIDHLLGRLINKTSAE